MSLMYKKWKILKNKSLYFYQNSIYRTINEYHEKMKIDIGEAVDSEI